MGTALSLAKHVGAPAVAGGALYALGSPANEPDEPMTHKWRNIRNSWGVGGGLAGLAAGHTLSRGAKTLPGKALSMILGGATGALAGTEYAAPEHFKEEARIRIARGKFPGGINPSLGAPISSDPRDLSMDPQTMYTTQRWGLQ